VTDTTPVLTRPLVESPTVIEMADVVLTAVVNVSETTPDVFED
jgi:hypothetical protein